MISIAVKQFFKDMENTSKNFDATENAQQFNDVFMHADPSGIQAITRDSVVASLDKRKTFFNTIGLDSTHLTVLEEIVLNSTYTLAKVLIKMHFVRSDGGVEDVEQTASYILNVDSTPQIVFYINDQLLSDVLQSHGLLPKSQG
jgi:hypothetical protein